MTEPIRIRVTRDIFHPQWTLSTVELDLPGDGLGYLPFGFGCEDTDRHDDSKIPKRTAIPVGTYEIKLYDSPKHGPDTLELQDVPGFRHVQIHSGNTSEDTEGCILIGLARDIEEGHVARSRAACRWLRTEVVENINQGRTATIEIRRSNEDDSTVAFNCM